MGRPAPAPPGMLSQHGFQLALAHNLDLLDGVHAGVTLFAIGWRPPTPRDAGAEAAAVRALTPLGCVGLLPDGRIGLIYLGPRGASGVGVATLTDWVRNRLIDRLSNEGWPRHAATLELSAAHGWTDSVATPRALIAALPPARRPGAWITLPAAAQ